MSRILLAHLLAVLLAVAGRPAPAVAQEPAESIAVWTERLRTGTLSDRADAIGKLAAQDPRLLPPATQDAIITELRRINDALLNKLPIDGAVDLGAEGFGEYYSDLGVTAASFGSPEANRALVLSVGISRGVQRRVASLGDEAIPVLAQMIDRDYQAADALETLALAWFWADSTGSPLSDASRLTILREMLAATRSESTGLRAGVAGALFLIGDPAFLPLARATAERARAGKDEYLDAGYIYIRALPTLESALRRFSALDVALRTRRALGLICSGVQSGARRGACQSLQNEFDAALSHLRSGRNRPAVNALVAVANRADTAHRVGAITEDERALIAEGSRQVAALVQ